MPLSTIGSNQITDGAIAVADVADGSITTAKIADDAVTSAKTDVTTLGTVEASKVLTANSDGNVLFPDNERLRFGTGGDLHIYHNGSNSYIDEQSGTGALILKSNIFSFRSATDDAQLAKFVEDGVVELYHNGTKKLETTSTGIAVTGGIDFSANANVSGMTSELLDDYEEGEFTPAYSPANGAFGGSYLTQKGRYTKIGRQVHVEFQLVANFTNGTQSGNVQVSGLPFTATAHSVSGSFHALQIAQSTRFSGSAPKAGQIGVNDTKIFLFTNLGVTGGGSDQTQLTTSNFILSGGNPNNLVASITYFAD